MEPHVVLAHYDATGKLTVWTSTQSSYFVQMVSEVIQGYTPATMQGRSSLTGCGLRAGQLSKRVFPKRSTAKR